MAALWSALSLSVAVVPWTPAMMASRTRYESLNLDGACAGSGPALVWALVLVRETTWTPQRFDLRSQ